VLGGPSPGATPEALWLLGEHAASSGASVGRDRSTARAAGGWVVMRRGGDQLVFDVGPLGCPISGGHGHADLLAVQCAAGGEPYLVDAGTGSYADPEWRAFFRSTAAHSTVSVDGESQAVSRGPFGWVQHPRARLRRSVSTEALDFADADHDAYRRLADPVRHRRRVLFDRAARCWLVVDDLDGRDEHRVEVRWQLAPRPVVLEGGTWARARGPADFLVGAFSRAALKPELEDGALLPPRGWISPAYGVRLPAPSLIYATVTRLPLRVLTVLRPVTPDAAPGVEALVDATGAPVGVVLDGGGEMRIADDHVRAGGAVERW